MLEAAVDKIIGSSPLSGNRIAVNYKTGACAFVCHGFFSVVLPKDQRRYDLCVSSDCREISALVFSSDGESLVIGEMGPNARFFILKLSEGYDRIVQTMNFRTKENGFSCMAMDSGTGRLITVGNDAQPFFVVWDTNLARPACIGCYHLPVCPTCLSFADDGSFALVGGPRMLKFVEATVVGSPSPPILKVKTANIGRYRNSTFVGVGISYGAPHSAYALTNDGVLCYFDSSSVPFDVKKRSHSQISITPIHLNDKVTSTLAMDKKIILVGRADGIVLAIKKDKADHKVFGTFEHDGKAVIGMGIGEKMTTAAYEDGSLIFWERRINKPPVLTIPGHRGPVCGLFVSSNVILSCGSDGSVREWKLQRNQELVGKSSQEQICARTLVERPKNYLTDLTGIRCVAATDRLAFAGDHNGTLHILKLGKLDPVKKIVGNFPGVLCVCTHKKEPYVATGGGDGKIRVYVLNEQSLSLRSETRCHKSQVTAILFTDKYLVSTSSDGVRFCSISSGEVCAKFDTDEALLSLAAVPSGKLVVAGGCDGYLYMFKVSDGSLFRRWKLSSSTYPLVLAIDPCGLFLAIAMSDGAIFTLDIFSGETIFSYQSMAGLVTSMFFHENDLLIASYAGAIVRWTMPEMIHSAVAEMNSQSQPILDIIMKSGSSGGRDFPEQSVRGSMMKGMKPQAGWLFKESHDEKLQQERPLAQERAEEEDEVEQAAFDAPRPSVAGAYESRVDDIVRTSFMRRNQDATDRIASSTPPPPPGQTSSPRRIPSKSRSHQSTESEESSREKTQTRADEMRAVAKQLASVFEDANRLLAVKVTSHDEVSAQQALKESMGTIKGSLARDTSGHERVIRDYAQKILLQIERMEQDK